jgi:hypothetical protein
MASSLISSQKDVWQFRFATSEPESMKGEGQIFAVFARIFMRHGFRG